MMLDPVRLAHAFMVESCNASFQVHLQVADLDRYCGGRITPSCGHHLHLAFDEFKHDPRVVRSLWNLFHRFNEVLFGLVAPSRRDNSYCRPMPSLS